MVTKDEVLAQIQQLSDAEQRALRTSLPAPKDDAHLAGIWRTLLIALTVIAIVALAGAILLAINDKPADAAWAVTTAAVGALGGLLAPSPVSNA